MRRRGSALVTLAGVATLAAASVALDAGAASGASRPAHPAARGSARPPAGLTLLTGSGIGPLHLGMSRGAARRTGWLGKQGTGCPLGRPIPVTNLLNGPRAPRGLNGIAEFDNGRLHVLSFTGGVRTAVGVIPGATTTLQMADAYTRIGFQVQRRYDSTFRSTFVHVLLHGKQVIGGAGPAGIVTLIGVPDVPTCD